MERSDAHQPDQHTQEEKIDYYYAHASLIDKEEEKRPVDDDISAACGDRI
jgi:hypothetical protein